MSHEIESNFVAEYDNEAGQCARCTSFQPRDGEGYCAELHDDVPPRGHCDFFQSID